jgi:hypothetical protein
LKIFMILRDEDLGTKTGILFTILFVSVSDQNRYLFHDSWYLDGLSFGPEPVIIS